VAIALDDALLGWLVASAGDKLLKQLRADPARAALRTVVEEAVAATVAEVANDLNLDDRTAAHLRSVLRERDKLVACLPVTSVADLHTALSAWTTSLNRPVLEFDEPGYLTSHGIDPDKLCQTLTAKIVSGITIAGRAGGPLERLARWLWHDRTTSQLDRIANKLDDLPTKGQLRGGLRGGTPDFIGRQQALAELAERIQAHNPAGTVVAIHAVEGMAGVGKTQLAVRAAHQHKHRYPDGHFDIDLHGYTPGVEPRTPLDALEVLLRQAGVPGPQIPTDLTSSQDLWQTLMATKQALILLDNARDVDQVLPLLPHAAGCLVLITSRSWLPGLPGRPLWLDVLSTREAVDMFTRLTGADRCHDQQAVARIVETIGRLPVAIRAVAGQLRKNLNVTDLAADLASAKRHQRLVDATSPLGTGVRAAFDSSLQRLDAADQRVFRALGLHPGPTVGVPQLAALADLPPAHANTTLRTLADRNLVAVHDDRAGSYQLHDLMREFARQQSTAHISEQERLAAVGRLVTWYNNALNALDHWWSNTGTCPAPPTERQCPLPKSLDQDSRRPAGIRIWLIAERDNILALANTGTTEETMQLCRVSARNFYAFDHYATARALFVTAIDLARQLGDRSAEAGALLGLAGVDLAVGEFRAADKRFRAARIIYRDAGEAAEEAGALCSNGHLARLVGDYTSATAHFRDALDICRRTGNRSVEAEALFGLGDVVLTIGDHIAAEQYGERALAICQELGDEHGEAGALIALAKVDTAIGRHERAVSRSQSALEIWRQIDNGEGQALALRELGSVAASGADYSSAARYLTEALAMCRSVAAQPGEANMLRRLGEIAVASGDYDRGERYYREAVAIYRRFSIIDGEGDALNAMGGIALDTGDHRLAHGHYQAAIAVHRRTGSLKGLALALYGLGRVALVDRRPDDARDRWQEALEIYVRTENPLAAMVRDALESIG
jgi:tetratricopeptide (TPR) repeat protein